MDYFREIRRIEVVYIAYDFLCAFARRIETHIRCTTDIAHDDFTVFKIIELRFGKLIVGYNKWIDKFLVILDGAIEYTMQKLENHEKSLQLLH